jgi:hypothetical protein
VRTCDLESTVVANMVDSACGVTVNRYDRMSHTDSCTRNASLGASRTRPRRWRSSAIRSPPPRHYTQSDHSHTRKKPRNARVCRVVDARRPHDAAIRHQQRWCAHARRRARRHQPRPAQALDRRCRSRHDLAAQRLRCSESRRVSTSQHTHVDPFGVEFVRGGCERALDVRVVRAQRERERALVCT